MPVVVVITERDRLVRPQLQRRLAASIPHARVMRLDGADLAGFTRPEVTAETVAAACDLVAPAGVSSLRPCLLGRLRQLLGRRRRRSRG